VKDVGFDHAEMRSRRKYQTFDKTGRSQFGIKMYPFSSSRKRSGQAVPMTDDRDGPCRLHVKGASEIILKLCKNEMSLNGNITSFSDARRQEILNIVEKFASQAMRTICLAYRDFDSPPDWEKEIDSRESERLTGLSAKTFEVETNLTFLGVMGILDPIRTGVPKAIESCNRAGVDVRMVTGDHKATAIAIAKECGILRRKIDFRDTAKEELIHPYTVMTGDAFRNRVLRNGQIDKVHFDRVWPHLRVLARSSPEDKHTLVSGLCESELYLTEEGRKLRVHPDPQIVAVTGDGTNDAYWHSCCS
jgi:Ca2+ transporting ATPase